MKRSQNAPQANSLIRKTVLLALCLAALHRADASPNLVLWDTSTPLANTATIEDRSAWKAVPCDLLTLEADPPKARSDPGYYGREYVFKGDAVVENKSLIAVFWSAKGRVLIYAKGNAAGTTATAQTNAGLGTKLTEIYPLEEKSGPMTISRLTILHNAGDALALEAGFSAEGAAEVSEVFMPSSATT
jgi:hypothetical protein